MFNNIKLKNKLVGLIVLVIVGFAVVAAEVRKLAERSQVAAS